MSVAFEHKAPPTIHSNGVQATIHIRAYVVDGPTILDHEIEIISGVVEGDSHTVTADPEQSTPALKVLAGVKALIIDIASRAPLNLSLVAGDITDVTEG